MSRVKKGLASRVAGSKTGRAVILQVLGEEGANIVAALKSAVDKTDGHDKAKETKELIFKFVLKAKIMGDDDKFDLKKTQAAAKPIMDLLRMILRGLAEGDEEKRADSAGGPVDITELRDQFSIVHGLIRDLMAPNMQDKNVDLFNGLFNFIGGEEFVTALFTNPDLKDEKHELYANLNELMLFDDVHAQSTHSVIFSQSEFGDKYSSVISCVREFWHKVDKQADEVGMNIFQALVENNNEYYNQLEKCIYGEDPAKQHLELLGALNYAFKSCDDWPKLVDTLKKLGSKHEEWAPGMPIQAYDHMISSIHDGFRESFQRQYSRRTQKSFDVLLKLMAAVMKESYTGGGESKSDA